MTSARSFGNYNLASALADLVDNSLKAKAHTIGVFCHFGDGSPEVRVVDDGHGMSLSELLGGGLAKVTDGASGIGGAWAKGQAPQGAHG